MEHHVDSDADLIAGGAPYPHRGETFFANARPERLALEHGLPRPRYPAEPLYADVCFDDPPARRARIEPRAETCADQAWATAHASGSPGRSYAG